MLPTEELSVHVYVLIDDLIAAGAIVIPPRGPDPACSDAELPTIAMVGHLLGRRSEAGLLAEVAGIGRICFPGCRTRARPTGASAGCGAHSSRSGRRWRRACAKTTASRPVTSALPVKHTSRVRGPDGWTGPNSLHARSRRDAAHAEWCYGSRLAIKTDLGSRIVRARSIVPAAVNDRDVAQDLLEAGPPPRDLLRQGLQRRRLRRRAGRPRDRGAHPPPETSAAACQRSRRRSSPSGATGSRPPSAKSPT